MPQLLQQQRTCTQDDIKFTVILLAQNSYLPREPACYLNNKNFKVIFLREHECHVHNWFQTEVKLNSLHCINLLLQNYFFGITLQHLPLTLLLVVCLKAQTALLRGNNQLLNKCAFWSARYIYQN